MQIYLMIFLIAAIIAVSLLVYLKTRIQSQEWKNVARKKLLMIAAQSMDLKFKLIEYDKLLEYVLKNKYGVNSSLGNILKQKASKFEKNSLNSIWFAHKLRNDLVHNIETNVSDTQINEAVNILARSCARLID